MAYKVNITRKAKRDINEILDYLTNNLHNHDAALALSGALKKKIVFLAGNPYAYEISRLKRLSRQGYRRVVVKNYLLLYLVDSDQKTVNIIRVVYGRQDYENFI